MILEYNQWIGTAIFVWACQLIQIYANYFVEETGKSLADATRVTLHYKKKSNELTLRPIRYFISKWKREREREREREKATWWPIGLELLEIKPRLFSPKPRLPINWHGVSLLLTAPKFFRIQDHFELFLGVFFPLSIFDFLRLLWFNQIPEDTYRF